MPRTLFEKVWDEHVVTAPSGQAPLLYVDLHLVHEVTSPQAFDGLRAASRQVRSPQRTIATVDHNIPTEPRGTPILDPIARKQIETLQKNCREFGVRLFDVNSQEWTRLTGEMPARTVLSITGDEKYVYFGTTAGIARMGRR